MEEKKGLRQQVMELLDQGIGVNEIARRLGKLEASISNLKQLYLRLGAEEFIRNKKGCRVSGDRKRQIVSEYLEKGVSLRSLSLKYGYSMNGIKKWIDKATKEGLESLTDSAYGKQKGMARPKKERPIPPEVLEENRRLKQENEDLRMENALLKKVKALVEARDARLRGTGQEPSKN